MDKGLLTRIGEAIDQHRDSKKSKLQDSQPGNGSSLRRWLPSRGNFIFMVLIVFVLLWVQSAGALPSVLSPQSSTSTIAYQGRLADAEGNPLTDIVNMIFRLYDIPEGGAPLWEEQWTGSNGVHISDGLFNVMLGSLSPIPQEVITGYDSLYLGISVDTDDEMAPRVQLGSVPYAVQALSVPDGSVTTQKIADGAVDNSKLDTSEGLSVDGPLSVTGDITLSGVFNGTKSYVADYRDYLRFMYEDGVTESELCPEGGTPVGVVAPKQSFELLTGDDICAANYDQASQSCVNVHHVAPCGSIIGNHFPYSAESCSEDFSGKWAPFHWWKGEQNHDVTHSILGSGISCFPVKYACCD